LTQQINSLHCFATRIATPIASQEVKCMLRCRKLGVDTPAIAAVDRRCARVFMELIPGRTVREYLLALPAPIHEIPAAGA
jgi:tRNA A-37 threonylcarbamoyl transferase component Bud32